MKNNWFSAVFMMVCFQSSVSATQVDDVAPAIINGEWAKVTDYPYFASLYYDRKADNGQYGYLCGATILDESHILTAAHCVAESYSRTFMSIAIGVQNENEYDRVEVVRPNKFFVHPKYDPDIDNFLLNDIAVIKLETPLETYSDDNKVTLASMELDRATYRTLDTDFMIIGHGKNTPDGNTELELAQAPVHYSDNCHTGMGVPQSQICFESEIINDRYRTMCNGDSGGPMLWEKDGKLVQIGIASWMLIDCGNVNYMNFGGVYTEVAQYTNWIESVLSGHEQATYEVDESVRAAIRAKESGSGGGGSLGFIGILALLVASFTLRKK